MQTNSLTLIEWGGVKNPKPMPISPQRIWGQYLAHPCPTKVENPHRAKQGGAGKVVENQSKVGKNCHP